MPEYALVSPADAIREVRSDVDPGVPTKAGWRWLPVERSTDETGGSDVFGEVRSVLADRVTIVQVGRAFTTQETSDRRDGIAARFDNSEDIVRAAVLVIMEELNRHSDVEASILAAAATATSLADFKTRMGQIAAIPARTAQDLKSAIRNKLGNGG